MHTTVSFKEHLEDEVEIVDIFVVLSLFLKQHINTCSEQDARLCLSTLTSPNATSIPN